MLTGQASDSSAQTQPEVDPHPGSDHLQGHYYAMPLSVRSTPEFTARTLPIGLLSSHRLALIFGPDV
jgi:hypothetical protein